MTHWLRGTLGLNVEEATLIVAILALIVAIPAAVPSARSGAIQIVRRLLLMIGTTRRRYVRWFLRQHGKVRNIYRDQDETLDLAQTYVSLSFAAPESNQEKRVVATNILGQPNLTRIFIVGDPGSGKSTLLSAFGTGILRKALKADRSDLRVVSRSREIPFIVRLRHFAKHADGSHSLANYVIREILQDQAKIGSPRDFLQRALKRHRCLLLLDGLDEVPDDKYDSVKNAILEFADYQSESLTHQARIVISCRRQNFLRIEVDWIPAFSESSYALAPLRDSEIYYFLSKREADFTHPRTVDALFADIKTSGTFQLHRTPLILTVSLGMYLHITGYVIPRSISKFYETMIGQLLTRHDFRGDPAGKTNKFNADDKYRFLREFAFKLAVRPGEFEDFTFQEAVNFATEIIPNISHVSPGDAENFVREIIDRSGLLTRTSDEDEYIFAHRSIQEYLIAVQLQRDPGKGAEFLLTRAADWEWRQVITFFASLDHQYVQTFIESLTKLNLELAGYCLAAAGPVAYKLADDILSLLSAAILRDSADATISLAALVSITGAQRATVRERAIAILTDILGSFLVRGSLVSVLGGDPEGALRLLHALAETDSIEIAAKVPALLAATSLDDERIVGVLWRCLAAAGMEEAVVSRQIVERLLLMIMSKDGFDQLNDQPAYVPGFVSDQLRKRVYPFDHGLKRDSNLVTLLCWAEHQGVKCSDPNRFLEADYTDTQAFASVERDWRRRTLAVHPFVGARIMTFAVLLAAYAWVATISSQDEHRIDPFNNWFITVPCYFIPSLVAAVIAAFLAVFTTKIDDAEEAEAPFYTTNKAIRNGFITRGRPISFKSTSLTLRIQLRSQKPLLQLGFAAVYKRATVEGLSNFDNANLVFRTLDDYWAAVWAYRYYEDSDMYKVGSLCMLLTVPYAVALAAFSGTLSIAGWLILSTAITWLAFWFPATVACARSTVWFIRKPNSFVDMYEDDRSKRWIIAGTTAK